MGVYLAGPIIKSKFEIAKIAVYILYHDIHWSNFLHVLLIYFLFIQLILAIVSYLVDAFNLVIGVDLEKKKL